MVWGWLIAMVFIQCVAMSMAELCSSMPTSGGLYYAAAVLAPPGYGPLAACKYQMRRTFAQQMTLSYRVNWMVELAGTSHRRALSRLRLVGYGPRWCFHKQTSLCPPELPSLPVDDTHHAHSWMHQ